MTVKDFVAPDNAMVETFAVLYEEIRDPGSGLRQEFLVQNKAVGDRPRVVDVEGTHGRPNRFGLMLGPEQIEIIER